MVARRKLPVSSTCQLAPPGRRLSITKSDSNLAARTGRHNVSNLSTAVVQRLELSSAQGSRIVVVAVVLFRTSPKQLKQSAAPECDQIARIGLLVSCLKRVSHSINCNQLAVAVVAAAVEVVIAVLKFHFAPSQEQFVAKSWLLEISPWIVVALEALSVTLPV